ncbi:ATP synthase mitochondrial F1 complex assembly factor 2 [Fusarium torreyae]|uniref:ATP synthase mitochondrial F1 complex assembly factor 2 n=1 Tax=Fusarium torreyae TaxID=1237075 RepID=A0A9W8VG40_9HYPO|nr:ATP synthase mitochondrial F1 complex assembly factor 2 [Fusarium torreyae]
MKPVTRLPLRLAPRLLRAPAPAFVRPIHSTVSKAANVAPVVGTGPPPEPPTQPAVDAHQRVARRRRQAEMLKNAKELRSASGGKGGGGLKKRFWKDVTVREVDGALQVFLDTRPLRHPVSKEIVRIPVTKPDLASALALEWDLLTSAQDATRHHLIPLTSLTCRALDIAAADKTSGSQIPEVRNAIATTLLRYLDTDSILCWNPPAGEYDLKNDAGESLRDVQKRMAEEIVSFLTTHVWPGITIVPVLDGHSIMPQSQAPGVREVVQGWITGLDAFEIAGLERAALAGKSLIAAARFIVEWSEGSVGKGQLNNGEKFGVEKAAAATSLEVDWQTGQWGEVEDTHDVNKEDVRRQMGSVALLVSGTGKA